MSKEKQERAPRVWPENYWREVWHQDCPEGRPDPPMIHHRQSMEIEDGSSLRLYECTACRVLVWAGLDRMRRIITRAYTAAAPHDNDDPETLRESFNVRGETFELTLESLDEGVWWKCQHEERGNSIGEGVEPTGYEARAAAQKWAEETLEAWEIMKEEEEVKQEEAARLNALLATTPSAPQGATQEGEG